MRYAFLLILIMVVSFSMSAQAQAYQCGDGKRQAGEECDWGQNNSDTRPNTCRTDCRRAHCGDGVADSGEQCDRGDLRLNLCTDHNFAGGILGCKPDCTYDFAKCTYCGDNIVNNNELCDDGNNINDDGCNADCTPCVLLNQEGNIEITEDTVLCSKVYNLDDYGDFGAITIKKNGVTLECRGAVLIGEGRGVGIYSFRSNNVAIKNCKVYGYEVGVRIEDAKNVALEGNRLCNNRTLDIEVLDAVATSGKGNACTRPGEWNDSGYQGCERTIKMCKVPAMETDFLVPKKIPGGKRTTRPLQQRRTTTKQKPDSREDKLPEPLRRIFKTLPGKE